ncbi:hypothetical protein G7070_04580 [Propioniciclava coleopterorum]|uniref:DUF7691 domain-containing protein n=1 Tax=Propioniciclava coleopterorum TaxID=2714937 RepID=A0A6G7Y4W3_9ACTN|nr:hypothetical protein [Propioniciclava coleopterorum]QIK71678.1 hypothetical protein G7070_04580 [Propioniciclava coleopterorum]
MGNVSLIAVGIDDVRELFSGSETRVAELRDVTERTWPTPPPRGGLLSKLGPFSRRAVDAPVVHPGVPTGLEIDAVAHGRDVPPDRLSAAWALVGAWLAQHGWGHFEIEVDRAVLDGFDFDLATQGVPAELGLRGVFRRSLGLPLKPLPGQTLGYARGAQATAMASHWGAALPALEPEHRALAEPIASWLAGFPAWTRQALEEGRPAPDLIAAYRA